MRIKHIINMHRPLDHGTARVKTVRIMLKIFDKKNERHFNLMWNRILAHRTKESIMSQKYETTLRRPQTKLH